MCFWPIQSFIAKILGLMSRDTVKANCCIPSFWSRCSLGKLIRRVQLLCLLGLKSFVNALLATNHQRYFSLKVKASSFTLPVRKKTHCLHMDNFYKEVYLRLYFMFNCYYTSQRRSTLSFKSQPNTNRPSGNVQREGPGRVPTCVSM